jgi:hypothetical protein
VTSVAVVGVAIMMSTASLDATPVDAVAVAVVDAP